MSVEFPRMATIPQAHEESGIPTYRIRQLCKSGQVRSVQCGRKVLVNLSSLAAWMQGDAEPVQPGIHRVQLLSLIHISSASV